MTSGRNVIIILVLILITGCGGGEQSATPSTPAVPPPVPTDSNVLAVTVNGTECLNNSYINKPCVSVTVCSPGTSDCQTIKGLLLDTGSVGLRVFKQALSVPLTQTVNSSGSVAECIQFGDGSSVWGPVQTANIILGGEPSVQVPIQVIDSTFGSLPGTCLNATRTPQEAGFNGILGVGLFTSDCGTGCAVSAFTGIYFSCNGTNCSGSTVPVTSQVQNPVASLPADNNGVIVQLPAVPPTGAPFINGTLVLGIGTRSNNIPSGVTTFPTSQTGEFTTVFNGVSRPNSFIDSGSNGLYFTAPASLLPVCPSPNTSFYCPPTTTALSAINIAAGGSPSGTVNFQIGNFNSLIATSNLVFSNVGGVAFGTGFDWGLPFFFGRNVVVGISGRSSTLGTGPYWAY